MRLAGRAEVIAIDVPLRGGWLGFGYTRGNLSAKGR
jgi:hypothetical protein